MNRADIHNERRAAVDDAIRACFSADDGSGYAVTEAVLRLLNLYDLDLGFAARHFERAISEEVDEIRSVARADRPKRRAPTYSAAEMEAKCRVGYWFARFVQDERCCSAREVLHMRPSSVTTLACAELYRTHR